MDVLLAISCVCMTKLLCTNCGLKAGLKHTLLLSFLIWMNSLFCDFTDLQMAAKISFSFSILSLCVELLVMDGSS